MVCICHFLETAWQPAGGLAGGKVLAGDADAGDANAGDADAGDADAGGPGHLLISSNFLPVEVIVLSQVIPRVGVGGEGVGGEKEGGEGIG